MYGGRGGAKSESICRALLLLATQKPLRVLCARATQKSLKESSHAMLKDLIVQLGLEVFYDVQETCIKGINGSLFIYTGLASHTISSVKSYSDVSICWIEEADAVGKKEWDILLPTIRAPESEVWISFNPSLISDETYQRFVVDPPDDAVVVKVGWQDNPYFPDVLHKERLNSLKKDPLSYQNIWEGEARIAAEGAIYANELANATMNKQICRVPYDQNLKTFTVWDIGFSDETVIIIVQRNLSEIRIIDYIHDSMKTLSEYVSMLNAKPYVYAYDFLPHDARNKTLVGDGRSVEERLKSMGRKVKITQSLSIEQGIQAARDVFHQLYFDADKTAPLIESLRKYCRTVNSKTGQAGSPIHSDPADAFRYMAINATQFKNEERKPVQVAQRRENYDYGAGY